MFLSIFVLLVKYQKILEQHICVTKKQENEYVLMEYYSMLFLLEICVSRQVQDLEIINANVSLIQVQQRIFYKMVSCLR